jgi:hypothetical protein
MTEAVVAGVGPDPSPVFSHMPTSPSAGGAGEPSPKINYSAALNEHLSPTPTAQNYFKPASARRSAPPLAEDAPLPMPRRHVGDITRSSRLNESTEAVANSLQQLGEGMVDEMGGTYLLNDYWESGMYSVNFRHQVESASDSDSYLSISCVMSGAFGGEATVGTSLGEGGSIIRQSVSRRYKTAAALLEDLPRLLEAVGVL